MYLICAIEIEDGKVKKIQTRKKKTESRLISESHIEIRIT